MDRIKSGTKNLGIMEAIKELKDISITDRIRLECEYRLKAKRDRRAEDDFVFEQGKMQGIGQGRVAKQEEGIKSLINSMHSVNATNEQIINALMTEYKLSREDAQEKLQ